jgi:hypothetical protein
LGTVIREQRKRLALKQLDLAGLGNTGNRFIVDLENGKPTVQTNTTDFLSLGTTSLGRNVSGLTCALVGLFPVGATFTLNAVELYISSGGSASSTRFGMGANLSPPATANRYGIAGRRLDADGFATISGTTDALANRGNPWIRIGQRNYAAGVASHWTNGTQDLTNAAMQTAGNTSDTDSVDATLFRAGASSSPNGTQLSEIVLTHSTMTNDDRQKLEGYLAWKWGGV